MFHMNDDVLIWEYFWLGEYEQKLTAEFFTLLESTDRFLDVGAYTGWHSLIAAKKDKTIHAFEMIPRTVELLKININLNK